MIYFNHSLYKVGGIGTCGLKCKPRNRDFIWSCIICYVFIWCPQNSHVFTKLLCTYFINPLISLMVCLIFLTQFRSYCRCHLQCSISWGKLDHTSRSDSFRNMATKSSLLISHQSIRTVILGVLIFCCRPNSFSCNFGVSCVLLLRLRKAFTLDWLKTSSSALLCLHSLSCSTVYLCFSSFAFLSFWNS